MAETFLPLFGQGLLILASMLVGGLVFAAAIVPPVAVRVLDEPAAAAFLRAFWPRYYLGGAAGGVLLTLTLLAFAAALPGAASPGLAALLLAASFTACMVASRAMIPAINDARDAADAARFDRLHGRVMRATGAGIVCAVAMLVALAATL